MIVKQLKRYDDEEDERPKQTTNGKKQKKYIPVMDYKPITKGVANNG